MEKFNQCNLILFIAIGLLITLFIFYMTNSKVSHVLSGKKEIFADLNPTTNSKDYTEDIELIIDKYLNPAAEQMVEIKKKQKMLEFIETRLNSIKAKITGDARYETNGELTHAY